MLSLNVIKPYYSTILPHCYNPLQGLSVLTQSINSLVVHNGPSWENQDEAYIRKRVGKSKINAELFTTPNKKKEDKSEKENKKVITISTLNLSISRTQICQTSYLTHLRKGCDMAMTANLAGLLFGSIANYSSSIIPYHQSHCSPLRILVI